MVTSLRKGLIDGLYDVSIIKQTSVLPANVSFMCYSASLNYCYAGNRTNAFVCMCVCVCVHACVRACVYMRVCAFLLMFV